MAKKIVTPKAGQVIEVLNQDAPRLLVKNDKDRSELDAYDFNGELVYSRLLSTGALYDGYYVFAAHSLEEYFKKKLGKK